MSIYCSCIQYTWHIVFHIQLGVYLCDVFFGITRRPTYLFQCAKKQGIDYEAVKSCTSSSLGNKLEHEMAVKTDQLDPPHTYVPWITLNGVHSDLCLFLAEFIMFL